MPFRIQLVILFLTAFTVSHSNAETFDVWFGTTTPRNGLSKGIYHARFDTETGKLTGAELAYEISSPGFLAMHPGGKVLYSTGNIDGAASVVSFAIEGSRSDRSLRLLNSQPIGDGGAAHLSTDRDGKVLLSAQYGGGSTGLFELAENGSIARRVKIAKHEGGSGVVERRQNAPHAHWVGTSPDNRFAFVPDLGMDKVVIWKLNASEPDITPHGFGQCPPGGGPRHMKFHTSGEYVYVLNELALSITVFDYDASAGTMTAIQTIPTVSEEAKAQETFNSASEIRMHPSGKFVYSANRGNDTISAFSIDASNGKLTHIENEPIRGSWPRNFNIDPTGKWLIAAGRDSNTAAVFSIDQESGGLSYMTRSTVMVPTPICVLFGNP